MGKIVLNNVAAEKEIQAFQATMRNEDEIRELVLQTARWLRSTGSTQWSGLLSGDDSHNLSGAIQRGEVVAFRHSGDGELAASAILQQEPSEWDAGLWGTERVSEGNAVYLHRLVVNRRYAGEGLGGTLMRWIETEISFEGKDRIRLDCIANNEKLDRFYRSCGYAYMGESNGFSLFERMLQSSPV